MHVTTTPAEKSTLVVEVELPVDRVARAVADATRRLSQRTRVAGFRPGKAPRKLLEARLGAQAGREEALELARSAELDELLSNANRIRRAFCGDVVHLCSIINAKSGACSAMTAVARLWRLVAALRMH